MSIKKLMGLDEYDHISDEDITRLIQEAIENDKNHIEIEDHEGNTIKIDISGRIPDNEVTPY
ncbi:hypothetical protein GF336_06005 [Candidatus Woesearchaeota archaeon]|nr:hypothetical protein [Candidatus Woesearchaeota archaeon]